MTDRRDKRRCPNGLVVEQRHTALTKSFNLPYDGYQRSGNRRHLLLYVSAMQTPESVDRQTATWTVSSTVAAANIINLNTYYPKSYSHRLQSLSTSHMTIVNALGIDDICCYTCPQYSIHRVLTDTAQPGQFHRWQPQPTEST